MTLSTSTGPSQGPVVPVVYSKPARLFTKREAALKNMRVVGKQVAQWHILTDFPTHYCRSAHPLSPDEIAGLRKAVQRQRGLTAQESRSLRLAFKAGQVVRANLYRDLQSFDDRPPTVREAAAYFEAHFTDGSLRSWITEYYHRGRGKKAVWTVGHSIHADDSRYLSRDLWKHHFKEKLRDLYTPQGVRHDAECRYTRWIVPDVDNHADDPGLTLAEWLARYTALHDFLLAEDLRYLAQVNPQNGSYQLWVPVEKWPLAKVDVFAERLVAACPWVREVYPTTSKWNVICPLRPDKVNVIGPGELPKVKCRPRTQCYDLVAAWRWHRTPTPIDPDVVRAALARSFTAVAKKIRAATGGSAPVAVGPKQGAKAAGKQSKTPSARGKVWPLRGRWLEVLSETYLDGVEPPAGSVVSFLTPQLRLFRDGETETARSFLRDVLAFLAARDWTFSDRVQNDPAELLRTLDGICQDRHRANDGLPLTEVDKTRDRLDGLGFDGSFASLLHALGKRRRGGPSTGIIDRPVADSDDITGAAVCLSGLIKADHQTAITLLRRILNHIGQRQELSYSMLKRLATGMGYRLSDDKTSKVFKMLLGKGLIVKTKNYSHCALWSIGNMYSVTGKVIFLNEAGLVQAPEKPRSGRTQGATDSCNDTISRISTTNPDGDLDDLSDYASEVARLRIDRWTASRIRSSLERGQRSAQG